MTDESYDLCLAAAYLVTTKTAISHRETNAILATGAPDSPSNTWWIR